MAAHVAGVVIEEYCTVTSASTRLALSTAQGIAMDHPAGRPASVMLCRGGKSVSGPVQSTPTFPHAIGTQHNVILRISQGHTYARSAACRGGTRGTGYFVSTSAFVEDPESVALSAGVALRWWLQLRPPGICFPPDVRWWSALLIGVQLS